MVTKCLNFFSPINTGDKNISTFQEVQGDVQIDRSRRDYFLGEEIAIKGIGFHCCVTLFLQERSTVPSNENI